MLPVGYKNGTTTVKAGKPVSLTFHLTKDAGCGNDVMVPAANWNKSLKVGEKATVTFTPKKSGPLAFACTMNHMKGTLLVK
jgi:plastocyanin domain-containing protein